MKDRAFDRRLRVAGFVTEGSMRRETGNPRFSLSVRGGGVPVVYTGSQPLPDTFQEGSQVVVEGEYTRDRLFHADRIQAKCSSKYEAELDSLRGPTPSGKKSTASAAANG
jgi:cytochrome c-type biogenesis protein CcmE